MARVLKRCPKCSRKITNKIECKHCGLLFERYFKAENQKRAEELAKAAKKGRLQRVINASVSLLFIAVIGGGAFYYFNVRTPASEPANAISPNNSQANNTATAQKAGAPQDSENVGRAKQATVAISTPWGNGTGFFVDSNLLLTNKHIVEQKKDGLAEARTSFETYRNWVAREYERLQNMKQQYAEMADGSKKEELGAIIQDGEEQYEKSRAEQQRLEDRVLEIEKGLENNQMHITMPDGQKMQISNTNLSQTYDLALLTVAGTNSPGIVLPPPGSTLIEGAQISIIGPR
ncbi:MAG: hypothetical protein V2I35_13865, partial [Desulfocapsaceae bacterium]|nr:hypothetical protein [Desulfocapsaceae bacterium]